MLKSLMILDREKTLSTKLWKIDGTDLPDLFIYASSFDETLSQARRKNRSYCGGQIIEKEGQ